MNDKVKQLLLNSEDEVKKHKSLIATGETVVLDREKVLAAIITDAKICESLSPQKFNWNGSKNTLIIITDRRIICGYKTFLTKHFEEILPQFILKCYVKTLSGVQSVCITTKTASMAIAVSGESINRLKDAICSIMGTISEYSQNIIGFPERDKNNKRRLTIYDTIITGVDHMHDNNDPQQYIRELAVGDDLILVADPSNPYDECAVKVCTKENVQIGWIPKGDDIDSERLQSDIFYRLCDNHTVLAKVKKKYITKSGSTGVVIDVARYAIK